jgi:hypothetical protein
VHGAKGVESSTTGVADEAYLLLALLEQHL